MDQLGLELLQKISEQTRTLNHYWVITLNVSAGLLN
jgi:hypothetical protein